MKRTTIGILLTVLMLAAASAEAQPGRPRLPGEQLVSVSGVRYGVGGVYELTLAYDPGPDTGRFSALMVQAQPSGTVLLALQIPGSMLPEDLEPLFKSALVSTLAPLGKVDQTVRVPFDPLVTQDSRIAVTLVHSGKKYLVADGSVPLDNFSFTTYFKPAALLGDHPSAGVLSKGFEVGAQSCDEGLIEHCCSGGNNCQKQCVCCQGPSFFCNLILCSAPECLDPF